ncbi:L,D-transpeptidase [Bosea sp. LjRoot9]|uniref:L,D-transpeptidase n=1 Tax=Bosea sp. LjRoot9 TaxID=3342341 RepID=UPI003ECE06F3
MRRVLGILAVLFLSFAGIATAQAGVSVKVDIAAQRMQVATTDGEVYNWAISSGRKGFRSPNGVYRPTRLEKSWYSRKYGGAMPYAVFFRGGYAIHGTNAVGALGRPASHGCIRLHTANAAKFFALVKKHGAGQTRIALNGAADDGLSQFAKASSGAKSKLAKAKARERAAIAQNRKAPSWNAAREQIFLRPALPVDAFGYQPYYPNQRWR